jgi:(p)ppGpp synthase/HD superfamily hydrolase
MRRRTFNSSTSFIAKRYGGAIWRAVASAYELTATLMTGQFRASGKTFIAHLVGTASILAFPPRARRRWLSQH